MDNESRHCIGAYENIIGSQEPEKYADLLVWKENPLEVEDRKLFDMSPEVTIINCEWVYKT